MSAPADVLAAYLDTTRERRLERFMGFIRIPSISGIPAHAPDCRRAAEVLAGELAEAGLEHVEVCETGGHPVVYADWLHAGPDAPTVLVYAHYDVQPVDPVELWSYAPFEPAIRDGRMLGRGSADDKAQVQMHVRVAEAILATRGGFPLNLRYVFEGEEEVTSEHLPGWLEANRERLAADLAVISDTAFFDGNLPAITVGLRGICYTQIDVEGPTVDLHSGSYGGAVVNPATALCAIVTALKGPDGRIRVPGFYDDVVLLSERDREAFAALPFDEAAWMAEIGVGALAGEVDYTTLERRSARPTLDVNGIWGGFTGEGPKTIIPAHAHAKVSCRLVANQDPAKILAAIRAFVAEIAPPGVRVGVRELGMGRPSLTPIDHPATRAAARAIEATFGRPPLYFREGGSIPVAASFEAVLGLPVVLLGFANPDSRAHAPDESMVLDNFETGIQAIARCWDELAALPRGVLRG
jgi:acetylornithine deacetylase/succinyl-diaminopimelate desuccinylase-like protein